MDWAQNRHDSPYLLHDLSGDGTVGWQGVDLFFTGILNLDMSNLLFFLFLLGWGLGLVGFFSGLGVFNGLRVLDELEKTNNPFAVGVVEGHVDVANTRFI